MTFVSFPAMATKSGTAVCNVEKWMRGTGGSSFRKLSGHQRSTLCNLRQYQGIFWSVGTSPAYSVASGSDP